VASSNNINALPLNYRAYFAIQYLTIDWTDTLLSFEREAFKPARTVSACMAGFFKTLVNQRSKESKIGPPVPTLYALTG